MPTYRIEFKNNHGSDGNYAFCTGKPIVDSRADNPNVMMSVWVAKFVPTNRTFTIETTTQYYAWCGQTPQSPAPGMFIFEGVTDPVELGSNKNDGTTLKLVSRGGAPTFDQPSGKDAPAGCYRILTGSEFKTDDNVLIGLGLNDDRGDVMPAAIIRANQNMTVNIQPVTQFYVLKTNSRRGEIISGESFSRGAGHIDFSSGRGAGRFSAVVSHTENGQFIVQYGN